MTQILLPGDQIPPSALPTPENRKKALTIGPGLRLSPPNTITTAVAGQLQTDARRNAAWVEYNSGRYIPQPGDLVIAVLHHSTGESYACQLGAHTVPATLPHLSFESATRKTRPILPAGAVLYARVAASSTSTSTPAVASQTKDLDAVEIECVSATTGKSEGLGPLKGGTLFDVSLAFARRLMMPADKAGLVVLDLLAEKGVAFELAVGRNGKVWVDAGGSIRKTLTIGQLLQETDRAGLGPDGQLKAVERAMKTL